MFKHRFLDIMRIALLALLAIPFPSLSAEFLTFMDSPDGYTITYPADFIRQPIGNNGNTFTSPGGEAEARVVAAACLAGANATPDEYIDKFRQQERAGKLSIQRVRKNNIAAVVSGKKNGHAWYGKLLLNKGWCTELTIEYDTDKAAQYSRIAKRMLVSFRDRPLAPEAGPSQASMCP